MTTPVALIQRLHEHRAWINGRTKVEEQLTAAERDDIPADLVVWATYYGHVDVLQLLLQRGIGPNSKLSLFGPTPLLVATSGALADTECPKNVTPEIRLEVAKLLIGAGANVKAKSPPDTSIQ